MKFNSEQLAILFVSVLQNSKIVITNSFTVYLSLLLDACSTCVDKTVKVWLGVSFLAAGVLAQLETKNLLCVIKVIAF